MRGQIKTEEETVTVNMQQTANLYSRLISSPGNLSWKDVFSSSKKQRTSSDMDYAMIAGTTLDTAKNELGMLQKWETPWLYRRVLLTGTLLTAVLLSAVGVNLLLMGVSPLPALNLLVIMVPPCIMPIVLMVFFWEMNAPRDVSLVQMLAYFFTGGILSLLITIVLYLFVPAESSAALTEEPAKLLVSLFLLRRLYRRNGKVYGFSGLALGAAVGAGFAAFESAQYAYGCLPMVSVELDGIATQASVIMLTWDAFTAVLSNILVRNLCAVCGHVLYCAPYVCIAALNMESSGSIWKGISSGSFWIVFLLSYACHTIWNMLPNLLSIVLIGSIITIVLWRTTLYGVRRSFAQLANKINLSSSATKFRIRGISGNHAGVVFAITRSEILIGSDPSCHLQYPVALSDIAPIHGKILVQNGNLYLADLGSRSGTTINGSAAKPMTGYLLNRGDRFAFGISGQEFMVE